MAAEYGTEWFLTGKARKNETGREAGSKFLSILRIEQR
jgi:hypothetical protein